MKTIKILSKEPLAKPKFLKTELVTYQRDNEKPRQWEVLQGFDTVHILVKNTDTNKFLLVKQNRIPVAVKNTNQGICIECCAGIIDKYQHSKSSLYQAKLVARDEILEELGYHKENLKDIELVDTLLSSVGTVGSKQYLFYCEVNDSEYTGQHLEPDEEIEVIEYTSNDLMDLIFKEYNTDSVTKYLCLNHIGEIYNIKDNL